MFMPLEQMINSPAYSHIFREMKTPAVVDYDFTTKVFTLLQIDESHINPSRS